MRNALPLSALALAAACAGPRVAPRSPGEDAPAWHFLRARYDADGDGRIQAAEYTRSAEAFHRLDADGDGLVTAADFDPSWDGVPRIDAALDKKAHGRWIGMEDFVHGEGGPEVGEPAPLFALVSTDGARIELASFRHKKPVALVFGSFT